MFLKYISVPVFLISVLIGLLYVYLLTPSPTIIYVYPTPDNVDKIIYKDKADNCFSFKPLEVSCSNKNVKNIPIQS
tara:strand:- start:288 stop:515 length:228 start_codon:yes stop_codon:yes gene_type:complete